MTTTDTSGPSTSRFGSRRALILFTAGALVLAGLAALLFLPSDWAAISNEIAAGVSSRGFWTAAGVGLRLKASKAHRVDASIDFVFGEDSQAFYFYIGEAF